MNKINLDQLTISVYPCNGRLTLESGVPVSTAAQADKTTLYFTPYKGNHIGFLDGTILTFSELSLNISAYTASKPYDIWIYNNAGTATLDSTVWTNTTTRATALALSNGIYYKSGDITRRYLGTIYMDSASKCQDTTTKKHVWNYYNRVQYALNLSESTNHTYNGAIRKWNNSDTNNLLSFVTGVSDYTVTFALNAMTKTADGSDCLIYAFMDASLMYPYTTNNNAQYVSSNIVSYTNPSVGYHISQAYESSTSASSTFAIMWLKTLVEY